MEKHSYIQPVISFEKVGHNYSVNYQIEIDGIQIEITGTMIEKFDGRAEFNSFEPDSFDNQIVEEYFDNNWEDIEDQLRKELSDFIYVSLKDSKNG